MRSLSKMALEEVRAAKAREDAARARAVLSEGLAADRRATDGRIKSLTEDLYNATDDLVAPDTTKAGLMKHIKSLVNEVSHAFPLGVMLEGYRQGREWLASYSRILT